MLKFYDFEVNENILKQELADFCGLIKLLEVCTVYGFSESFLSLSLSLPLPVLLVTMTTQVGKVIVSSSAFLSKACIVLFFRFLLLVVFDSNQRLTYLPNH